MSLFVETSFYLHKKITRSDSFKNQKSICEGSYFNSIQCIGNCSFLSASRIRPIGQMIWFEWYMKYRISFCCFPSFFWFDGCDLGKSSSSCIYYYCATEYTVSDLLGSGDYQRIYQLVDFWAPLRANNTPKKGNLALTNS